MSDEEKWRNNNGLGPGGEWKGRGAISGNGKVSPTFGRPGRGDRTMHNPLYAHAYSSFEQQQRYAHRHHQPPSPLMPPQQQHGLYATSNSHNNNSPHHYADPAQAASHSQATISTTQNNHLQKKRHTVRSILLLSALAFLGTVVLDGLVQFTDFSVSDTVESAVEYERMLVHGQHSESQLAVDEASSGTGMGLLRRLTNSLLLDENVEAPPHRSYSNELNSQGPNNSELLNSNNVNGINNDILPRQVPRALHTLPLIPKHALQHRQRRELMDKRLPIPEHLQVGSEDEMYHAENEQRRRRMYPVLHDDGETIVDARKLEENKDSESSMSSINYETGALYQGYGTHYLDLWVGTPPQRQTVILDTGSSTTAFPCTGCKSCGQGSFHLDEEFYIENSPTYQEKTCKKGSTTHDKQGHILRGRGVPCDLGMCTTTSISSTVDGVAQNIMQSSCQIAVSYAEGSTWTAVEGSDVVYPAGPHDVGLGDGREERLESGVGLGMGNYYEYDNGVGSEVGEQVDGKGKGEFDWMDFRLKFGCQKKVTGLFRTQLEDGIMGMDNRKGSFWLQLHEHYKQNGYVPNTNGDDDAAFDPAQFSLCYDRQPLSGDLKSGVGSGALTLGGTDPLLHNTGMVFAKNLTPAGGWYVVRIKAMFLRTNGGSLSEPHDDNEKPVEYLRVDAEEDALNGHSDPSRGVIADSGTTDTYLPLGLKVPFQEAWKLARGGEMYHNNPTVMILEEVESLPTILIVLQGHEPSNKANNENAIGMTSSHKDMFQGSTNDNNSVDPISKADVVVAVPPTHYMEESRKEPGKYTARVYFTERYGGQAILGQNFLMGHEVLFDNRRGRIGFAESHCDYTRYVEERDAAMMQQLEEDISPERVAQAEDVGGNAETQTNNMESDLAASGWARRLMG